MDYAKIALEKHREWKGKLRIEPVCPLETKGDLSVAYTPGVAAPCMEINKDVNKSYEYTGRGNLVAVITDGTAVLGLGDIGPEAGMPVMEGKCALFKSFANINAFPLCIRSKDTDEIVRAIELIAGSFGGINLEDISAPRCFEIESRLRKSLDIPVFHDDQHGTAVVSAAGIINALRVVDKKAEDCKAVVNGAGAAGISCARLLLALGMKNIIVCDRNGAIVDGAQGLTEAKQSIASVTNPNHESGKLADVIRGADLFLGVSAPGVLTKEMVSTMAKDAIVFACANPTPEIFPDDAKAGGAKVIGTGRSDYPNQINNVLAFPGIFRGALDVRASDINEEMLIAAAYAIASVVKPEELGPDMVIPSPFNKETARAVAKAVAEAARKTGVARI